jgi:hypothetical protein
LQIEQFGGVARLQSFSECIQAAVFLGKFELPVVDHVTAEDRREGQGGFEPRQQIERLKCDAEKGESTSHSYSSNRAAMQHISDSMFIRC